MKLKLPSKTIPQDVKEQIVLLAKEYIRDKGKFAGAIDHIYLTLDTALRQNGILGFQREAVVDELKKAWKCGYFADAAKTVGTKKGSTGSKEDDSVVYHNHTFQYKPEEHIPRRPKSGQLLIDMQKNGTVPRR